MSYLALSNTKYCVMEANILLSRTRIIFQKLCSTRLYLKNNSTQLIFLYLPLYFWWVWRKALGRKRHSNIPGVQATLSGVLFSVPFSHTSRCSPGIPTLKHLWKTSGSTIVHPKTSLSLSISDGVQEHSCEECKVQGLRYQHPKWDA